MAATCSDHLNWQKIVKYSVNSSLSLFGNIGDMTDRALLWSRGHQSMMAGPPVSLYPGAGDQSEGGITPRLTNQKAGLWLWRQFMRRRRRHRRHWLQRRERSWELNFKVRWMFVFCLNVHCILIFTDKERGLNNTHTLSKRCLSKLSQRTATNYVVWCQFV